MAISLRAYGCILPNALRLRQRTSRPSLESQWGTSDTIYSRELNNGGPIWEQAATWREQNPIRFAANFKTPILLLVGENDFRVPLNQTRNGASSRPEPST
jgi:hypothetical protein